MMSPVIDEIANETQETLKVCKVNVDDELELARKIQYNEYTNFCSYKRRQSNRDNCRSTNKTTNIRPIKIIEITAISEQILMC